jgi:hypothetical protein
VSPAGRLRLALLLLAPGLVAGCGRKIAPEAPLQVIPARPEPLRVTQEGGDVVLRFPFPSKTVQGSPLTNLTRVTVLREVVPAPAGARAPVPATETAEREREEKLFRQRAGTIRDLSREELDAVTVGSELVVRDPMLSLFLEKRLGRVFLRYGVTATRDRKRVSPLSPLVAIVPKVPPSEPRGLAATVEEGRVCLDWLPPAGMLDGTTPATVAGWAVYRREEADEAYGEPVAVVPQAPFVDAGVAAGRRLVYTVRAAPATDRPLVLGPAADEVLADTRDVFPPKAPDGFLVLAEDDANRLVWNPVLARDLAGYRVYARDGEGEWRRLADGLTDPAWRDVAAPRARRYGVSAADAAGNESPREER